MEQKLLRTPFNRKRSLACNSWSALIRERIPPVAQLVEVRGSHSFFKRLLIVKGRSPVTAGLH